MSHGCAPYTGRPVVQGLQIGLTTIWRRVGSQNWFTCGSSFHHTWAWNPWEKCGKWDGMSDGEARGPIQIVGPMSKASMGQHSPHNLWPPLYLKLKSVDPIKPLEYNTDLIHSIGAHKHLFFSTFCVNMDYLSYCGPSAVKPHFHFICRVCCHGVNVKLASFLDFHSNPHFISIHFLLTLVLMGRCGTPSLSCLHQSWVASLMHTQASYASSVQHQVNLDARKRLDVEGAVYCISCMPAWVSFVLSTQ